LAVLFRYCKLNLKFAVRRVLFAALFDHGEISCPGDSIFAVTRRNMVV